MNRRAVALAGAGALAIVALAGCGAPAGASIAAKTSAATNVPRPSPTADLPQLKVDFEVLNHQERYDLTTAAATNMFQAQTLENATQALRVARDGYLAFDTGLQHLIFPTSMSGDVTAALRADAQVEADFLSSIMAPTDVAQMQAAIAPASQILAGLATDTLRSDLGLPPAAQY